VLGADLHLVRNGSIVTSKSLVYFESMEEVALKNLDTRLHKQIETVRKALDKNPAYSVDVMTHIVERNPCCLEARKLLRKAQQRANKGRSNVLSDLLAKVSYALSGIGTIEKIKKDPTAALFTAEKLLNKNPSNLSAHKAIGIAAKELDLRDTVAFAYEEIHKLDPDSPENAKALMQAYIQVGKNDEAIRIGDRVYKANPSDSEIQSLIRQASVEKSIRKGNWEASESFRDKLKDDEEAHKLEQASKAKTTEAELRAIIKDAEEALVKEPENLNLYRDIFNGYRKLKEFGKALEWVGRARKIESGSGDINLERMESQLKLEKMRQAISDKEKELESDPENAELKRALHALREERSHFRLIQAEDFVARYPNELSYRFELAELYHKKGEVDRAIKELQLAQRSPIVRVDSLILLGKIYKSKRFYDLAAEQFLVVKSEISGSTDQKKEILYELGSCYELQNDMEKAIAEYKALYSIDIGYQDISKKIDDFYAQS